MFDVVNKLVNWKNKSKLKSGEIKRLEKKIRNLEKSRDNWKDKYKKSNTTLNLTIHELKKNEY